MTDSPPLLEIEDLRVHFPIRGRALGRPRGLVRAVDGVSLRLAQGETLALVGESGCGKSTTGNAVLGLGPVSGGRILFDGEDLGAIPPARAALLRRAMQVVFQDPAAALNPKMTIGAAICEPLVIAGWPTPRRAARLAELLSLVGLGPAMAGRHSGQLSGGQRQRVVIARALALAPRLVICDEPVSALDVSIRAQILNLLMRLQRELGLTYLFVAHDLSVVRHVADRVAVMYLGTIVEEGPTEALFAAPRHPYTQALLAAIPLPDPRRQRMRPPPELAGDLPSPADPPPGCPFVSRCPEAAARCRSVRPRLADGGTGTRAACLMRIPAADPGNGNLPV